MCTCREQRQLHNANGVKILNEFITNHYYQETYNGSNKKGEGG